MKNSHIQLPKGHMKPFSLGMDVLTVYKLDIQSKIIEENDIKQIDTEMGYYSDYIEDAMNREYENKFFSLRQKLVDFFEGKKENVQIKKNDRDTIIRYINLAMLRSIKTLNTVNANSVAAMILGGINSNYLVTSRIKGVLKENAFENYQVIIVKNNSDVNFVLPSNSYYFSSNLYKTHIEAEFLIVIPLTPKIALVLLPLENNHNFLKEHIGVYMTIENGDDIRVYNKMALWTELDNDSKFIISKTKSELTDLLDIF